MRKFSILILGFLLIGSCLSFAQNATPFDVKLWEKGYPNSNGTETTPTTDMYKVHQPEMKVFLPAKDKANGKAVVILPGGGYNYVAFEHEGNEFAPFFNNLGVAVIVLKYRMPNGFAKEVPVSDVEEAIRLTKENAAAWNINPNKVGILGCSTGGHLATTAISRVRPDLRPSFQILLYPVISMKDDLCYAEARDNFLGKDPSDEDKKRYSGEETANSLVPPTIMFVTGDDKMVSPMNTINYYIALNRAKVKAELHIYPVGGHGWGAKSGFAFHNEVYNAIREWLEKL